jgi:hypothetical protein
LVRRVPDTAAPLRSQLRRDTVLARFAPTPKNKNSKPTFTGVFSKMCLTVDSRVASRERGAAWPRYPGPPYVVVKKVYYRSAVSMAGTIHRPGTEFHALTGVANSAIANRRCFKVRPGNSTQNNEGSHGTQLTA